jgi:hypothetical protein
MGPENGEKKSAEVRHIQNIANTGQHPKKQRLLDAGQIVSAHQYHRVYGQHP